MKQHTGKIVAGVFVALVAVVFVWRLWSAGDNGDPGARGAPEGASIAVEAEPIERHDLDETREFTGTLEARSRFDIPARVSGQVLELKADLGDRVQRGQTVARLEDDEFVQELRQAEAEEAMAVANIAEARSGLLVARREVERVRALRERQIASESELDAAEAELSAAEARLKVAEATLAQREAAVATARLRLSYTDVRVRWEAEGDERAVAERHVTEGASVGANDPLLTLVDLAVLRGVFFVAERDYASIRPGQAAEVRVDALPGEVFSAEVARVAPVFAEGSRQARVEIEVMNEDERLTPGMFARVRVRLRESKDTIAVPRDSVVRRGGNEGIFVIGPDGENARFVEVELGVRDRGYVEVRSPEVSGKVVTLGHDQLTDGANIRIVGGAEAGEVASNGIGQ